MFKKSCYLFVTTHKKQFGGAHKYCHFKGGHLLHINDKQEDDFIKNRLIKFHSNITRWRPGGRKEGGKFVWYVRDRKSHKPMNYTAWAPTHPGKYSALALEKFQGTPVRYVWKGIWSGSRNQLPKYTYNFICEAPHISKFHLISFLIFYCMV